MEKNRKRFQFTIYLLDKIKEMWYNKEVAAENRKASMVIWFRIVIHSTAIWLSIMEQTPTKRRTHSFSAFIMRTITTLLIFIRMEIWKITTKQIKCSRSGENRGDFLIFGGEKRKIYNFYKKRLKIWKILCLTNRKRCDIIIKLSHEERRR